MGSGKGSVGFHYGMGKVKKIIYGSTNGIHYDLLKIIDNWG